MTVRESTITFKLQKMGVWDNGGTEPAGKYIFL